METGAFEQFFGELEDPRQSAKVAHLFTDILFLVLCASIAGAKGWEDRSHGNASQDANGFDQGRSRRRRGASPEGGADSTADYGGAES